MRVPHQRQTPPNAPVEPDDGHWRADRTLARELRICAVAVALLILVAGAWAGLAPLSGALVAKGKVAVAAYGRTVRHDEGGTVSAVLVKDGDFVSAGDLLVKLSNPEIDERLADLATLSDANDAEQKKLKRKLSRLKRRLKRGQVSRREVDRLQRQAAKITDTHARLRAEAADLKARLERLEVRSPLSGTVRNLALHGSGAPVSAGEGLLEIVPRQGELLIEARLSAQKAKNLRKGQNAIIRVRKPGRARPMEVTGAVFHVAEAPESGAAGSEAFTLVHIDLTGHALERLGDIDLQPGMPVEAHIQTGERTALSHLLGPFTAPAPAGKTVVAGATAN